MERQDKYEQELACYRTHFLLNDKNGVKHFLFVYNGYFKLNFLTEGKRNDDYGVVCCIHFVFENI